VARGNQGRCAGTVASADDDVTGSVAPSPRRLRSARRGAVGATHGPITGTIIITTGGRFPSAGEFEEPRAGGIALRIFSARTVPYGFA
jgi:hypothetical protein